MSHHTWPKSDQRTATIQDLRILLARGLNVTDAARELGVPWRTAYRWLGLPAQTTRPTRAARGRRVR